MLPLSNILTVQTLTNFLLLSIQKLDVRLTLDSEGNGAAASTVSMRILNVPFYGLGVAEVVASGTDKYPVGTLITANTGYENYTAFEYADNPYNLIRVLPAHARDESTGVALYNYVSTLGMPGLTALAVSFRLFWPNRLSS